MRKSVSKLRVLALAVMVGWTVTASADNMNVGAQAGLNLGKTNATGATTQTQFMGGVNLEAMLAEMFYIQPELNYMGQGPSWSYLTVPVLLKGKFDAGSGFRPYIVLGPELGLKLSGAGVKTINFALDFGAGFEVDVSPGYAVYLTGRYSLGLSNVNDTGVAAPDMKTRNIHILAGLSIAI